MVFRKGGALKKNIKFLYEDKELEIVSDFTYLGIRFSTSGSFTITQQTLAGQGLKAVHQLEKYLTKFVNIDVALILELFDKLIEPILCYGSEVWGFHPALDVERIHTRFCKRTLHVKTSTPNDIVRGELGRNELKYRRYVRIVKYWLKIVYSPQHKYIYRIYMTLYNDSENHKVNWCTKLRDLLYSLGMGEAWYFQTVGNPQIFLSELKQRLSDTSSQNWHERLSSSHRGKYYLSIHDSLSFAHYLNIVSIATYRTALCRLRTSSHRLKVETGRWVRPPIEYNDRTCDTCHVLDDEYHFVLECTLHKDARKKYIPNYYTQSPSMYKFTQLMMSHNNLETHNLAKFTHIAFKERM
jgi:hypothetical protein